MGVMLGVHKVLNIKNYSVATKLNRIERSPAVCCAVAHMDSRISRRERGSGPGRSPG